MTDEDEFLSGMETLDWTPLAGSGLRGEGLRIGKGDLAIVVAVANAETKPNRKLVLDVWKERDGGRGSPLLLAVVHPEGVSLCGPSSEDLKFYPKVDKGQADRLCRDALAKPDRHEALEFLDETLPTIENALPGIRVEGLVAMHELQYGVPKRKDDWKEAGNKASVVEGSRGSEILSALGYQLKPIDRKPESVLCIGERESAVAVVLLEKESMEAAEKRFERSSPASYAIGRAESRGLSWAILVKGDQLRLYPAAKIRGVGQRGRTESYVDCRISQLTDKSRPCLWLIYSAEALDPKEGSLKQILEDCQRFAVNLADSLRDRIYNEVVPDLARGIVDARAIQSPNLEDLNLTYEMALTVLFRLLFIAYAEDCDLLPFRNSGVYREKSLKNKAQQLLDLVQKKAPIGEGVYHWSEVSNLFEAIDKGHKEWDVPPYNGGLFSKDEEVSVAGAKLAEIEVSDKFFESALRALLVSESEDGGYGPVDFRSLDVRAFGTIYEGLLESGLAQADTDLTLDSKDTFIPAKEGDAVEVKRGTVYLHNKSGARKSSGSYYTKQFAVDHLLEKALEPALQDHCGRLEKMGDTDAAEAFFDFRVADIAMGSGHFLIAAIDRIEDFMVGFLANRTLPGVHAKLEELRKRGGGGYKQNKYVETIDDGQILRRLIASRCIYGVDLNPLSVQLARLAVWIHTFVPGLPLSMLDHTLVQGNALVGIGHVDDIRQKVEKTTGSLFAADVDKLLGAAVKPLQELANINDGTVEGIEDSRKARLKARKAVAKTAALCDLITARPISTDKRVIGFPLEEWESRKSDSKTEDAVHVARRDLAGIHVLHFPIAFPEVFLRQRPGFDAIIGNPPWKQLIANEKDFWARYYPRVNALPQAEYEARKRQWKIDRPDLAAAYESEKSEIERVCAVLKGGGYPGKGNPDLYKAFCWRFWHLTAETGGRIGVVLPRGALAADGSTEFRRTMLSESESVDIATLLNSRGWVFDEIHHQYTIGLVCITRGTPKGKTVRLRRLCASLDEFQDEAIGKQIAAFESGQALTWNDEASQPALPMENSAAVLTQLRKSARLDSNEDGKWRAKPHRELDANKNKPLMHLKNNERPEGYWPVYKGKSFDLWTPDTGVYYAFADPEPVIQTLLNKKPLNWTGNKSLLPCFAPRVAFRDITNAFDQRTVIACLLPPKVFIQHTGTYFLWERGDEQDQAFLLGILSSISLDWYARRFVERHVSFYIINSFPIPRPTRDDPAWCRVVKLAGRLASHDSRFADWAKAVGVECGPISPNKKQDMIHELDAVVAHIHGLSEAQLTHIFETYRRGWDYQNRLDAVLRHYRAWARNR